MRKTNILFDLLFVTLIVFIGVLAGLTFVADLFFFSVALAIIQAAAIWAVSTYEGETFTRWGAFSNLFWVGLFVFIGFAAGVFLKRDGDYLLAGICGVFQGYLIWRGSRESLKVENLGIDTREIMESRLNELENEKRQLVRSLIQVRTNCSGCERCAVNLVDDGKSVESVRTNE